MHKAGTHSTPLGLLGFSASNSAVGSCSHNRSSSSPGTSTASGGARGPITPSGLHTVCRAGLRIAGAFSGEARAAETTELSRGCHSAALRLRTNSARLTASTIAGPGRYLAVNRAVGSVALASVGEAGAALAAVRDIGGNGASLLLGACVAGLAASTVGTPGRDDTIDRAGMGVAHLLFSKAWANEAAVGSVSNNAPRTRLASSAA